MYAHPDPWKKKNKIKMEKVINLLSTKEGILTASVASLVGLYGLSKYIQGGHTTTKNLNKNLKSKNVIVTGANTGIGFETAQQLAKQGARVILACRNEKKAFAAKKEMEKNNPKLKGTLEVILLDIGSQKSIHNFVNEIKNQSINIHYLINNAGVMVCPHGTTQDGLELQMGTNHFGHFLLTMLLLDNLIDNDARIINVSSLAHTLGSKTIRFDDFHNDGSSYSTNELYSQSKLANILFSKALQRYISKSYPKWKGLVVSLHPGVVNTDLMRHYNVVLQFVARNFLYGLFKTPWSGCQTTLHCALDSSIVPGGYYSDATLKKAISYSDSFEIQDRFFKESLKVVHLDNPFSN
mmetsp:Transcript_9394/g.13905  ORF Transcript_9394/g.13905 Transcript_9394/m.13905 type:complete len:352 (-) Transcript_9394:30-1085(-)